VFYKTASREGVLLSSPCTDRFTNYYVPNPLPLSLVLQSRVIYRFSIRFISWRTATHAGSYPCLHLSCIRSGLYSRKGVGNRRFTKLAPRLASRPLDWRWINNRSRAGAHSREMGLT